MNEPDLNQFSGQELPWFPGQLLLVLTSLLASLMLAGAAWAYTDQNADVQLQARDAREQQRQSLAARQARPSWKLAQAAPVEGGSGGVSVPAAGLAVGPSAPTLATPRPVVPSPNAGAAKPPRSEQRSQEDSGKASASTQR